MAENLNYDYKINGSSYGNDCYDSSADSCAKYGRLYTWAAAMDSAATGCGYGANCAADSGAVQGVCPVGWHLPSHSEMVSFVYAIGGVTNSGKVLKATSGWLENGNGTDAFGFSALASGFMARDENGYNTGYLTIFWASTDYSAGTAYGLYLRYNDVDANNGKRADKYYGYSVRCVKD